MRIQELLETAVKSSWISDIFYDGTNVTLTVKDGKRYLIKGMPKNVVRNWLRSKSKGAYWNKKLRVTYMAKAVRIK